MNRISIIFSLFIFISQMLLSDNLNNYPIVKIKNIKSGDKEGELGWQPGDAGSYSGPRTFAITENNHFYIPDLVNYRLNVYNEKVEFLKTISENTNKIIPGCSNIYIDNAGNITGLLNTYGIKKINNNGEELFTTKRKQLPKQVYQYRNIFLINNEILFYNDQHEVEIINSTGVIERLDIAKKQMQTLSLQEETQQNNLASGIAIPSELKQGIEPLKNDNKHIIINDKFYSTSFRKNKKYFDQVKAVREHVKTEKVSRGLEPMKEVIIDLEKYGMQLIGYDKEHNSYWRGIHDYVKHTQDLAVIVFSKYGELLDAFNYGQYFHYEPNTELYKTSDSIIAVAPSGDVYFLVGSKEKYTMYKVERQW